MKLTEQELKQIENRLKNYNPDSDLEFIAHAITDIPALIADLREARKLIAEGHNLLLETSCFLAKNKFVEECK